ncbi:MAG: HPr kinase/phosphatase C-terminal domain-containing protein [Alphaproteobacteria bacterium]|nr:HPr kinase/phosphatase C-terminal domain-containing protein [Alphaproteobacteria bacterium]MBU1526428.1 HPr kinase/phosphatase C-terminal domain-containing protein [Alphaproteobacteria bacterium]MBU2118007.1 HPr kinase/phosphatase C-terminal domain-containing protein [Alphaproteobacteria bacterium]MBU2352251.1 HPr kinase/phosphatase C-terminal domain-containing protein [Alphaproteobacteria bacterium]MBU2383641.1 HPr kinase/phosphatase C-terminal domain-containing protein [Alphaproteobacteria
MTLPPLHATCAALFGPAGWTGVLLIGPSGAGKSDLALRLIADGARLVADDATRVWREGDGLHAACPETIAGRMEVRGLGIVGAPGRPVTRLGLVVACAEAAPERLPDPELWSHAGVDLPLIRVDARAPSAAAVVRHAIRRL